MSVGAQGAATSSSLAERWDGQHWTVVPTPATGAADTYLTAVSCSSADACAAVGYTQPGQGLAYPGTMLVERWNGSAWAFQVMPHPGGSGLSAYLMGVSCPSAARCVAVGFYSVGGTGTGTIAAAWNGQSWSLQPFAYPSAELLGVSCAGRLSCVAVGQSAGFQTAADRWDGSAWKPLKPPNPTTPIPGDSLSAVGCARVPSLGCQAVGLYGTGDMSQSTFGLGWNGSSWAREYTPSPGNNAELGAVSCGTASACIAVGGHVASGVGALPLIGAWNGSSWSTQRNPLLRGTLDGVSCTSATACTAVGLAQSRGGGRPLIERWNGTSWSLQAG
jgi:hypothetical protein